MKRAARAAGWIVPPLFCLWLYWDGLMAWFQADDFAWLSLHRHVYSWRTFVDVMFSPMAQGTIRPWSERGFFLLFWQLFGVDALPYRIFVFATQIANLLLLARIIFKLTESRLASFAAPVLWTASAALAIPMVWTSAYNQVMCAFFLLTAFALYLEGRFWLQFVVFALGFGALEINIVYPAIVVSHMLLCTCSSTRRAGHRFLWPALLFTVSAIYFLAHRAAAPFSSGGPYSLHIDPSMLQNLRTYWQWSFDPIGGGFQVLGICLGVLLALFAINEFRQGRRLAAFFLVWFLITLAPVLPLSGHVSNYYLVIPAIGLASAASLALAPLTRLRAAALAVAGSVYIALQVPYARDVLQWNMARSQTVRNVVLGVVRAHELHAGKALLLDGVGADLYNTAIVHDPFYAIGVPEVFLTPESVEQIPASSGLKAVTEYAIEPGPALRGLERNEIEVYNAAGDLLTNITARYTAFAREKFRPGPAKRVDVGQPLLAYLLGPSWYPVENDHRWMPKRASVRMEGPRSLADHLILTGICPVEQVERGALTLRVSVNGIDLVPAEFTKPETPFSRTFNLPPEVVGKGSIEVTLEVSRTFDGVAQDGSSTKRALGLVFGTFAFQ